MTNFEKYLKKQGILDVLLLSDEEIGRLYRAFKAPVTDTPLVQIISGEELFDGDIDALATENGIYENEYSRYEPFIVDGSRLIAFYGNAEPMYGFLHTHKKGGEDSGPVFFTLSALERFKCKKIK